VNVIAGMALNLIPQKLSSQPIFQHSFSRTSANILRMAGKSPVKPDGKWPHAVYSFDVVCFSIANRS